MSHILLKAGGGSGSSSGGTSDHGSLSGLLDNDHPQYSSSAHTHTEYSVTGHIHDLRYYTESEIDSFLNEKADFSSFTAHTGTSSIHFTEASINYENILNTGHSHDFSVIYNTGHTHPQYSLTSHTHSYSAGTDSASFTAHTADTSIHFTEASIDIDNIISGHSHGLIDLNQDGATHSQVIAWNSGTSRWQPTNPVTSTGGTSDHGGLTGLLDNDHPQYRLTATTIDYSEIANTGHVHTISEITDFDPADYTTDVEFDAHTGDSTIHFTEASIDYANISNTGHSHDYSAIYNTGHNHDFSTIWNTAHTHTVDFSDVANTGHVHTIAQITDFDPTDYTTDTEFDTHTGTSNIHFLESSIDIANITSGHTHPLANLHQDGASTNDAIIWNGGAWVASAQTIGSGTGGTTTVTHRVGISLDGGGSEIESGIAGDTFVLEAGTITSATLIAEPLTGSAGSIVVDIWVDDLANHPPTDDDSITSGTPVTISSDVQTQDTTLTDWTTNISANSVIRFNVDSVDNITKCQLVLGVET